MKPRGWVLKLKVKVEVEVEVAETRKEMGKKFLLLCATTSGCLR